MKFPAYWSKSTVEETDASGKRITLSCWRWSDVSPEDAHESAMAAAARMLRGLMNGDRLKRYGYGQAPLREEVMQRFNNQQGELIAAVTQNAYGVLVLNTARAMFVDLDFQPVPPGQQLRYWLTKWFREQPSPEETREREARGRLERFVADNPQFGIRVYRTFAGLRLLVTHELFDPAADETRHVFLTLGSDPLYMRLCQAQQSFRARLTPKPWRCGHSANRIRWPRETDDEQSRFAKWQAAYVERQGYFATCRFLGALGGQQIHPEVEPIIAVHDEVTRCEQPIKLA